jgi:hypothetical protein
MWNKAGNLWEVETTFYGEFSIREILKGEALWLENVGKIESEVLKGGN